MTDEAIWNAETRDRLAREAEKMEQQSAIAAELMAADPKLSFISAIVMAGDKMTLDRAKRFLTEGMSFESALVSVGSYYRLAFALWAYENKHITRNVMLDALVDDWSSSDPDDTDPRFLELWRKAFIRNNWKYVRDGRPLPRGAMGKIIVYRGQDDANGNYGIAWTTDPKIAERFANGAATRQRNRGGKIIMATVKRTKVLAYLTDRGESETIIDPRDLEVIQP